MEITEENILEIWEMFCELIPASKRNDLAIRYIKLILDQDIELSDLEDIRGEDEHLDHAFEYFSEEEYDAGDAEYEE